jgi:tetratricopeptide (TPR) repeat protein
MEAARLHAQSGFALEGIGMQRVSTALDHEVLGHAFRAAGRRDEAIAAFEQALLLNPNDQHEHGAFEAICELYRESDPPPDAYYEMVARQLPNQRTDATLRMELARWHEKRGELDKALEMYRSAAGIRPAWKAVHRRMAPLAHRLGHESLAFASYQFLLRDRPGDPRLVAALEEVSRVLGIEEKAAAFLAEVR